MRILGLFPPAASCARLASRCGRVPDGSLRRDEPAALRKSHYPEIPGSRLRQRHRLSWPETPLEKGFNPLAPWEGGKMFLPHLGVCAQQEEWWESGGKQGKDPGI